MAEEPSLCTKRRSKRLDVGPCSRRTGFCPRYKNEELFGSEAEAEADAVTAAATAPVTAKAEVPESYFSHVSEAGDNHDNDDAVVCTDYSEYPKFK